MADRRPRGRSTRKPTKTLLTGEATQTVGLAGLALAFIGIMLIGGIFVPIGLLLALGCCFAVVILHWNDLRAALRTQRITRHSILPISVILTVPLIGIAVVNKGPLLAIGRTASHAAPLQAASVPGPASGQPRAEVPVPSPPPAEPATPQPKAEPSPGDSPPSRDPLDLSRPIAFRSGDVFVGPSQSGFMVKQMRIGLENKGPAPVRWRQKAALFLVAGRPVAISREQDTFRTLPNGDQTGSLVIFPGGGQLIPDPEREFILDVTFEYDEIPRTGRRETYISYKYIAREPFDGTFHVRVLRQDER